VSDTDRDTVDLGELPPLDVGTLTLGEMAEVERQSGRSFGSLLTAGHATRSLLRLFVHELRTSERPRSWHALADLRPLGSSSSDSRSSAAGRRAKSSD
jgi:hypothetical protein